MDRDTVRLLLIVAGLLLLAIIIYGDAEAVLRCSAQAQYGIAH
jgi:hypothetical protein